MKLTFATFAIGMMALVGVPFFFSGFWSKEAILHAAHTTTGSHLPFYAALDRRRAHRLLQHPPDRRDLLSATAASQPPNTPTKTPR
jgi:hypothetical protein